MDRTADRPTVFHRTAKLMDWTEIDGNSLTDPESISSALALPSGDLAEVMSQYPARINSYYLSLIEAAGDGIFRQVVPYPDEVSETNNNLPDDPIGEEVYSPVPNLSHRYHDRVLFLVSDRCPIYCRFCTRKRKVGRSLTVSDDTLEQGFRYIGRHPEIRDVLLSGGDPLMLPDGSLDMILGRVGGVPHVEIKRIGTRVPAALPQRVTPDLADILKKHHPLFIHTHFNHPSELTPESREACRTLADAGLPMGNQTVLLKGVNDDPEILEQLFRGLLTMRIRPYYLLQGDMVRGTAHFRTAVSRGLEIMETLHRRTSPMALPYYVVDLPQARGKVILDRGSVLLRDNGCVLIRTPEGDTVAYPETEL